jgi:hypothetical protein
MIAGLRAAMEIGTRPAMRKVTTGAFDVPASDSDADLLAHAPTIMIAEKAADLISAAR